MTPEQATALLQRAGVPTGQIQQVQQLQAQAGAAVDSAKAQLQPLLDQLSITQEQFNQILAQLSITQEQFSQILQKLSLAPEAIGQLIKQLEATPAQLEKLAADIRAEAVKAEPPIGTRASRVVHLFGAWLSVPFKLASDWLLFALALLVVTKLLGGRATLPKHLRGRGPSGRAARAANWSLHPRHGRGHDGPDGRGDPLLPRVFWHSSA